MSSSTLRSVARRLLTITTTVAPVAVIIAATYAFSWPGTYDLVGSGFSNGTRYAVLQIAKRDTAYTVKALEGPPGAAVSVSVAADTARIMWNFGTASPPMYIELLGAGDSVAGRWTIGADSGPVTGKRR